MTTLQESPVLTPEQQRILDALISWPTKSKAAQELGMSRQHLYRHLKDPDLALAYEDVKKSAIQDAFDSAASNTVAALAVLYQIAHNSDTPPSVRVQAASKLIDVGLKSVELEDVKREVEELKRVVGLGE